MTVNLFSCFRFCLLLALLIAGAAPLPLRAQSTAPKPSKPEVRKEVVAVIEGQLAALRAADYKKAYTFAAAALRAQTPLPQFQRIVETNYPEIAKNTKAEIGIVRDDGTHADVLVQVYSKDGSAGYDYGLVKERDGAWRIDRVLRHAPKKDDRV